MPEATLSGRVFEDLNGDGIINGSDTGINGVTITLTGTDDLGAVNRTTTTSTLGGVTGSYKFSGLRSGTYTVTETQPGAYQPGRTSVGTVTGSGSAAGNLVAGGPTVNQVQNLVLVFGSVASNYNFGEERYASISGYSYIDTNGNGSKNAGETVGVPGATITLTGTDYLSATVGPTTTTTGAGGGYSFTNLLPGTYSVTETKPAGLTHTGAQVGTGSGSPAGTAGSDVLTQYVQTIAILSNGSLQNYNFGHQGTVLGGFVYVDLNNNGLKDPLEPGIPGVTVTLSGTALAGGSVCGYIASCNVVTDSSGAFSFVNIPASDASGYTLTEQSQAIAPLTNYTDGIDSRGTVAGIPTGNAGNDVITGIVIATGQVGSDYLFGEQGGSISGRVYLDVNNNGAYNSGIDAGIAGVTIALSGITSSGANVCTVMAGVYPACSVTTAADGGFSFTGLPASNGAGYTLTESQPVDYADRTTTAGTTASGSNICATIPSCTTTTIGDGSYNFAGLRNANGSGYSITETQPSAYLDGKLSKGNVNGVACAGCNTTVANVISAIPFNAASAFAAFNFGEVLSGGISGRVYHDFNNNNSYDAGEELPGVTITLTGTDDQGAAVSLSTATIANGTYSFTGLRPSNAAGYTLTESQPAGIGDYPGNSGTQIGTVNGTPTGTAALNQVTGIVVSSGTSGINYNFRENASSLRGFVYHDVNDNGSMDGGESGIAGVTITLSGSANRTTTTAADGSYQFIGLNSGVYTLTETQPIIYQDGRESPGNPPGTVDNASFTSAAAQNRISSITLPIATAGTGYLFGERTGLTGSFSGTVWYNSITRDQTRQPGEPGLLNWRVEAVQGNAVLGTATTAADGTWTISGLPSGSGYELRFRHTSNSALYGTPVSQDPGYTDSTPDYSARTIANMVLRSGGNVINQNLPVDPSGVVYDAVTRLPVSGATVRLTGPGGFNPATQLLGGVANATQVTSSDGFYQYLLLAGAPAGVYAISVTPPIGYVQGPSGIIPATSGPFTVPGGPTYAVQTQATAPSGAQPTTYYLSFTMSASTASVVNNHIPVDPILGGAIIVIKRTPLINVTRGDLVPYTIEATNTLSAQIPNINLVDIIPPGFRYRTGSANLNGVAAEPAITGRTMTWSNLTFAAGEKKIFRMILVVGSGVTEGEYTNQAWALNYIANAMVSNIAKATVRVIPDTTFDCPDIIGKVFDDKNSNGYQDEGEPGIANVRLATVRGLLITTDSEGRFHIPCPEIPNADRGSNFLLKLDERTLPSGYRITTENPLTVRITRGKMVKMNFGAAVHRVFRIELTDAAFEQGSAKLLKQWEAKVRGLDKKMEDRPTVARIAYRAGKEPPALVNDRMRAVRRILEDAWKSRKGRYPLTCEEEVIGHDK